MYGDDAPGMLSRPIQGTYRLQLQDTMYNFLLRSSDYNEEVFPLLVDQHSLRQEVSIKQPLMHTSRCPGGKP